MNVIVIGNGGREHAIAWRLKQSPSVTKVICPNGNPGIAQVAEVPREDLSDAGKVAEFAKAAKADLVVIGPEQPLAMGVADACLKKGLKVFGPVQEAARLETSKAFMKEICQEAEIPTAESRVFEDHDEALAFALAQLKKGPVVIKADGLAAGKGVVIAQNEDKVRKAIGENLKDHRFGEASRRVLVEEFLEGEEVSLIALVDGSDVFPLTPAQDFKRAHEGDQGPNTGGMGCYAPVSWFGEEYWTAGLSMVLRPAVAELARRGITYRGALYAGLIVTKDGPKLLEFNCRFGDPETQVLLPLLDGDFGEILLACAEDRLQRLLLPPHWKGGSKDESSHISLRPDAAVCVVMAAENYPDKSLGGHVIDGLNALGDRKDAMIFHANTTQDSQGRVLSGSGRVLGITAWASSLKQATEEAYALAEQVHFTGAWYRKDIARKALQPVKQDQIP